MSSCSRHSNFEFLRILCMAGVLIGHVIISFYLEQMLSVDLDIENQARVFLLNACAVAVNCFVIISGYFTIKLTWKKVVRFWGMCWWYAVIGWMCFGRDWKMLLFPITESGMWFLPCYLGLMSVSPLLNAGLEAVFKASQGKWVVMLLLFADVYLGYWHQLSSVGQDGYGLFHFVCMYSLGYLIAHGDWRLKKAGWWVIGCLAMMTVMADIKQLWWPMAAIYSLHFNSPMLIVAATLVFLWAKGLKIESRAVNGVASSVFAVYLVHCNPTVAPHFYDWCGRVLSYSDSEAVSLMLIAGFLLAFFMGCVLMDKVRVGMWMRIERWLGTWVACGKK